jgi:hypothetical protein
MTCIATKIRRAAINFEAFGHLFKSIASFLRRLDCYTKIPPTPGVMEMFVETLVELFSTLSLVTRQYEQGLLSKFSISKHV